MSNDNFDVNSLLDGTLDDLADMPEFKPFPAGTHTCLATLIDCTAKKSYIAGHPAFKLKLVAKETNELADTSDKPLVAGDETEVLFMLDNEMGQGSFKKILAVVGEKFGAKSNRELAAEVNNLEVLVVTGIRENKDKTKKYTDVVEFMIV